MLRRLSIRWRLAGTSATLTFAILCVFALAVGELTDQRIRSDFQNHVAAAADDLRDRIDVAVSSDGRILRFEPDLNLFAGGGEHAAIRVLTPDGTVIRQTKGAPDLGSPIQRTKQRAGYRIETRPIPLQPGGTLYVQYARPLEDMEATLTRVHFFLLFGVLGGTALALLAGLMLARRAMAPIAALTATAEQIRRTRDPDRHMPSPETDDEVGQLARTLDEMLHALSQSQAETAATLERQREFVADASHELRTPLTSVLANLELLAESLQGDNGEAARSALRSSRRMRRLVADLLLLARADTGREATRTSVDLGSVVIEAAAELEPVARDHHLEVDVTETVVHGARDELLRLTVNLIENALRHTPPGTNVRATVRREGTEVVLAVEDGGPGIAAEARERIFERFVRGEGEAAASFGLGLSIVRAVTLAHGGRVEVGESPWGGARFVVRLPADRTPVREPGPQPAPVA